MVICDNCNKPMDMQEDDGWYCPYCGYLSGPVWDVPGWDDPTFEEVMDDEI